MDLSQLNDLLSVLVGPANVQSINYDDNEITAELTIKFHGDAGTHDKGEVEIEFFGIEILNIPLGMMPPVSMRIASKSEISEMLNVNYIEPECHAYIFTEDEGIDWSIYAQGYRVNHLPVCFGKRT